MEEDQSLEWEINCPCSEDGLEAEKSKLSWLLNTGVSLGKNLVITGVVISSVPLVLPPLVVISALGFALSVPFGFVFASYACSQKLMSKLLPSPSDDALPQINEEEVVANAIDQKEEKEEREATKDAIEMRIELVDEDDVKNLQVQDELGYLDVDEWLGSEEKDDATVGRLNNIQERKQHSLEPTPSKDIAKPSSGAADSTGNICGNASKTEDHAVVFPEGHENTSSSVEDAKFTVQTDDLETEEGEQQNVTNKKKEIRENLLEDKNEESEKDKKHETSLSKEIVGLRLTGKRKEPEGDMRHERSSTELLEETESSSDSNLVMAGEKLCSEEVVDSLSEEKEQAGDLKCSAALGSEYLDNKQSQGNDDVGNMDSSLEKERKPVGLEEMDIKNIEERTPPMVYNDRGESYNQSRIIADDGEYSVEVAVLTDIHDEEIPELKDASNDACKVYSDLNSDHQGLYCDENIWKKIDAIRAIVGFKAPRRTSYFEELKALYLFTGIEPPSSSTDPSDLSEFYNKLCFLMSVIGLK